jgi:hypothetical protein
MYFLSLKVRRIFYTPLIARVKELSRTFFITSNRYTMHVWWIHKEGEDNGPFEKYRGDVRSLCGPLRFIEEGFSLLQILKVFYYNNRLFENILVRRHCKRNRKEMSFKDGMVDDDCRVLRSK